MKFTVVTASAAYDFEYTVKTFILVIYNALYFQNMDTNLVPPIMIRLSGLYADKRPKLLSRKQTEINQYVYFPMLDMSLIFHIEGTILYLITQKPLKVELKEYEGE